MSLRGYLRRRQARSTSHGAVARSRRPDLVTSLPPPVTARLTEGSLHNYWVARARQHTQDSYAGVRLSKLPEDLRTYEHLLWMDAPDTVIELGTQAGGSALWFRDRLRTLFEYGVISRSPRVVTVDLEQGWAREELARVDSEYEASITLLEGDIRLPETVATVRELVAADARCLLVEDSAHEYETTMAALVGFAPFVPSGGFFVVEDGCVDIEHMRIHTDWPRGVLPALHDWLRTPEGRKFTIRRDLELYGVSCHPEGFLQRRPGPSITSSHELDETSDMDVLRT
jgi:cephalosporin hydroxylase